MQDLKFHLRSHFINIPHLQMDKTVISSHKFILVKIFGIWGGG